MFCIILLIACDFMYLGGSHTVGQALVWGSWVCMARMKIKRDAKMNKRCLCGKINKQERGVWCKLWLACSHVKIKISSNVLHIRTK